MGPPPSTTAAATRPHLSVPPAEGTSVPTKHPFGPSVDTAVQRMPPRSAAERRFLPVCLRGGARPCPQEGVWEFEGRYYLNYTLAMQVTHSCDAMAHS